MCGLSLAAQLDITDDDVCYLSMPLFHSNGVAAGWSVAIAAEGGDGSGEVLGVAAVVRHPRLLAPLS